MTTSRIERRLVAILAADVVGYARLMEHDEDRTLARLKVHRKELFEPLVAEYQGRVVKLTGDGALCEFASVVDAVRCAALIQQGMAERERDAPEEEWIRFRVGVNLGDVIHEEDGDLYGDGVNIAARLEQLCEPGGVLVSGTAYDHLEGKLDLPLEFAGQQRVKNIERLVRAYRVRLDGAARRRAPGARSGRRLSLPAAATVAAVLTVLALALVAGAWWWSRPVGLHGGPQPAIAVLPLLNASGDPDQEYLSDGVTEDIIAQLSRFQDLMVIASDSTATYKGQPVTPQEVGRALDVGYVMSGSIARGGDRLRVSVRVSDARTGRQVWGESYDNEAKDLLAVRDEVTSRVVGTLAGLQGRLTKDIRGIARGKETGSVDAYTLVLRGDDFLNRYTKEDNDVARDLFLKALALDPEYSLAYADLAWTEVLAWQFGWSDDPARALDLALEHAERAVALDDLDADAHWVLGYVLLFTRQYERATVEYERARAITPNYADVLADSSTPLFYTGRAAEGIPLVERAVRLNPFHPSWYAWSLGRNLYGAGQYERAIRTLAAVTDPVEPRLFLLASYVALGQAEEAHAEVANIARMEPGFSVEAWVETQPFRDPDDRRRLLGMLRKAGLPAARRRPAAERRARRSRPRCRRAIPVPGDGRSSGTRCS